MEIDDSNSVFFDSLDQSRSVFDQPSLSQSEYDKRSMAKEDELESINLWQEKYRPKTKAQMIGNIDVLDSILGLVQQFCCGFSSVNGFILNGRPGVGKTTSVHVIVEELLRSKLDQIRSMKELQSSLGPRPDQILLQDIKRAIFREINASDSTTQSALEIALSFLGEYSSLGQTLKLPKIVLIDECDGLDVQSYKYLLKTLKQYRKNGLFVGALFFFTCNDDRDIPMELKNHTNTFSFQPITTKELEQGLAQLISSEKLNISDYPQRKNEWLLELGFHCNGDFRQFYSTMGSLHSISGSEINLKGLHCLFDQHGSIPLATMHKIWKILSEFKPKCQHKKNSIGCLDCDKPLFIIEIETLIKRKYTFDDLFCYWIRYIQSQPFPSLKPRVYDQMMATTYKYENQALSTGHTRLQWNALLAQVYCDINKS
jgi:DNA polymerase III delta prime subunit